MSEFDPAVLTIDIQGIVRLVTPAAARLLGMDDRAPIGEVPIESLLALPAPPTGASAGGAALLHQLQEAAPRSRSVSVRASTGSEMKAVVSPLLGGSGGGSAAYALILHPSGALSEGEAPESGRIEDLEQANRVLEERVRAHALALETSEQRFHLLVTSVKDYAIILLDPDGRIVTWNEGARQVKGYEDFEILGESMELFYTPEDLECGRPTDLRARALRDGRVEDEGVRLRKDGTRFEADVILTALHHPSGEHLGYAKVTRDVTERRSLEHRLQQSEKMEAIGRLAGGIAHDFNNVLGAVTGFSTLARRQVPVDHPVQARLDQIERAAERAADLTRQMLAFGRRQVLHPRALDLNAEIEASAEILRRLIGEDVRVALRLQPGLGSVMADPTQLQQVLMNLAINARDAMPAGGSLTIETADVELDEDYAREHVAGKAGPYVMLAVADTGVGMDATTRAHVFEPFFTTKPEGKGTGLGLATVYGIVKQSGGFVWLYSEPGQGATFKIYLPRVEARPEPSVARQPSVNMTGTETILLVEDQDALRTVVRELLEDQGYTVLDTADVLDALGIARAHDGPIHLLLSDVVMPEMGGPDLALAITAVRPDIRTLFMSGYTNGSLSDRGLTNGDVLLIEKPFTSATLSQAVRKALDARG